MSDFNSRFDSALSDLSSAIRADERCRIDAEVWPLRLAAERARIRRELLSLLDDGTEGVWGLCREDVDRICPAQDGTSSPSTTSSTKS